MIIVFIILVVLSAGYSYYLGWSRCEKYYLNKEEGESSCDHVYCNKGRK